MEEIAKAFMILFGALAMLGCASLALAFPLIAKIVACREIARMAMALPEADRERWINEQFEGLAKASKRS